MAVAYKFIDEKLGVTGNISQSDAVAQQEVGYVAIAKDPTYGLGEFMYCKFTAAVAAGDLVIMDRFGQATIDAPAVATKGNFGISMGAQTGAATYGWVMIRGVHDGANVLTGSAVAYGPNYGSVINAGRITSAVTASYIIDTLAIKVSGAANVGTVEIYWPTCSGR